mmetsp:Transcript_61062/g.149500  ORF Transcript_61062/g.149500 Transcript_61062/m.149500 type:complete len:490 (+) Transcript_61062:147-1616(+)
MQCCGRRYTIFSSRRNYGFNVCLVLIVGMFLVNLLVAFVTIDGHDNHFDNQHHRLQEPWWYHGMTRIEKSHSLRGQNSISTSSNSDPWHRILRENSALCPSDRRNTTEGRIKREFDASSSSSKMIRSMGFYDSLRNLTHNDVIMSSFGCGPSFSPLSPHSTAKASAACDAVTHYSVIVLSSGKNLRRVVTTIMSFQSYPSVSNINLVLLPDSASRNEDLHGEMLLRDNKYGARILMWKESTRGNVNVITKFKSGELWDAIDLIMIGDGSGSGEGTGTTTSNNNDNRPENNGVLWINADRETKDWNGSLLKQRLQLWKAQPTSLVAKQLSPNIDPHESCAFDLHGLMMHPSHLCYMQHPATKELRSYIKSLHRYRHDRPVDGEGFQLAHSIDVVSIGIFMYFIADTYIVDDNDHDDAPENGKGFLRNMINSAHTETGIRIRNGKSTDGNSISSTTEDHRNHIQSILDYFGGCSCSSIVHLPQHKIQRCSS